MAMKNKLARSMKRASRVRSRLSVGKLHRVSVYRSLKQIYAQIIDDNEQKTVASCSSLEMKNIKGDKKTVAKAIGKELAQKALKLGINQVLFDRGSALFHGRVAAIADGLKEGGLQI